MARNRGLHRSMSAVAFEAFGAPEQVLKVDANGGAAVAPTGRQVAVQIKAAMVTTEDVLAITGANALRSRPGVAGLHAIGVVTAAGPSAANIKAKDTVLVTSPDAGTWQNNVTVDQDDVVKVPEAAAKHPLLPAAVTAALALQTANLKAGDVVLQNNGGSAVARAVAQLAKAKGVKVVSVVQGDNKGAQGDVVVSANDIATPAFANQVKGLGTVKLVLDGVGDKSAANLSRLLGHGGVFAVVGTSGLGALKFPVRSLIFDDITVRGVNLHRTARLQPEVFARAVSEVSELVGSGKLQLDGNGFNLTDAVKAVGAVQQGAGDVYLKF